MSGPALLAIAVFDPATAVGGITVTDGGQSVSVGPENGSCGAYTTIGNVLGSTPAASFKFYVEAQLSTSVQGAWWGLLQAGTSPASGGDGENGLLSFAEDGTIRMNDTTLPTATADTFNSALDVAQGAFDITNQLAWFRTNSGHWNGDSSADPATGVGGIPIALTGKVYIFGSLQTGFASFPTFTFNFGQSTFQFPVPDGYTPGWGTPLVSIPPLGVLTWDGVRLGSKLGTVNPGSTPLPPGTIVLGPVSHDPGGG